MFDNRFNIVQVLTAMYALAFASVAHGETSVFREIAPPAGHPFFLGGELQLYRPSVHPNVFPVVTAGANYDQVDPDGNEFQVDAQARVSPSHPKAYTLEATNLWYGERDDKKGSPIRLSFGRRYIGWSFFDEGWQLGAFEPLSSWDRLRSTPQGLIGLFGYSENRYLEFRVFGTYVHAPEMMPNVVIENGQFSSEHPQAFTTAPQTYNILNHSTPLGYQLDIPDLDKIIFQPGIVLSIETKDDLPAKLKFVYGYLPLNYFPIALQSGGLSIPISTIVVHLKPLLYRHHLYNTELSANLGAHVSMGAAVLVDVPVDQTFPGDYNTTPLSRSVSTSPWIQYRFQNFEWMYTHLWVRGGLEGGIGQLNNTSYSSRLLYRNASQLALKYRFETEHYWKPEIQLKAIHEFSIDGQWYAGDVYFHPSDAVSFFIGGDVIGASLPASPDRGAEFLADTQALDRIRLGVTYAF